MIRITRLYTAQSPDPPIRSPMPFFKNSNASQTSTSSSAPLQPKKESVFDSSSSKSPLFSPNYQVVRPSPSWAPEFAVLTRGRRSPSTRSPTRSQSCVATRHLRAVDPRKRTRLQERHVLETKMGPSPRRRSRKRGPLSTRRRPALPSTAPITKS